MRQQIVAAVAVALLAHGCGGDTIKALRGPGEGGTAAGTGAVADVGETITLGTQVSLSEDEDRTVTVLSVELVGNRGLTLVGTGANGPAREFAYIGAQPGFPAPGMEVDRLPLPGALVPGGDPTTRRRGLAIAFGLRRDAPGRGYATGFAVRYEIEGKKYRQAFKTGFTICAVPGFVRGTSAVPPCEMYTPDPDGA